MFSLWPCVLVVIPSAKIKEYHINAITGGTDALAEVIVKLEGYGKEITTKAANEDIVRASVEAIIDGINKIME